MKSGISSKKLNIKLPYFSESVSRKSEFQADWHHHEVDYQPPKQGFRY